MSGNVTRLTLFSSLLYFGFCDWSSHVREMVRVPGSEIMHGFRTIDDPSAGTIRVANRDAIVERYEEGVGVSIRRRMLSAKCVGHR